MGFKPTFTEKTKPTPTAENVKPTLTEKNVRPIPTAENVKPTLTEKNVRPIPTERVKPTPTGKLHGLPEMVRALKTFSSRRINENINSNDDNFSWHRSYYDRVIRNEYEYWYIKQYIGDNPKSRGDELSS